MSFSIEKFFEINMNQKLKEHPESMDGFDCIYQFEIDGRIWNLDLTKKEKEILEGSHPTPDCILTANEETFEKLVYRRLNPAVAIIRGSLKISGKKILALKLGKLFS